MKSSLNPLLALRTVELTDGSTFLVSSTTSLKPKIKLSVDSMVHPSFNPHMRNKLLLGESLEVTKFKERYSFLRGISSNNVDKENINKNASSENTDDNNILMTLSDMASFETVEKKIIVPTSTAEVKKGKKKRK